MSRLSTNEANLIGFVGSEPKEKKTKNGTAYSVVNLATNESWKKKQDGEWVKRTT